MSPLVELLAKTDLFGGTTAYSGGGMWLPLAATRIAS